MNPKVNIAILASGSGSNAENIIQYFDGIDGIDIALVACNRKNAFVFERLREYDVPVIHFDGKKMDTDLIEILSENKVNFIILAGFLLKISEKLLAGFENKIINIHPALLPKYGGKGMYGDNVHQAVIDNGEQVSGITIHLVNAEYDEGRILFQAMCEIEPSDTPESLAEKVHELEYNFYPQIIEDYIRDLKE